MSEETRISNERLAEILEENRLLKELHGRGAEPEILIHISSYAPSIVVDLGKGETVLLEPNSHNSSALIPYDVYLRTKRHQKYFQLGYLYSDKEEDMSNPNLILDAKEWISARPEAQMKKAINEITSEGALNFLYECTEEILNRQTDERKKTGKIRTVRQETMTRMSELFGYSLVEDSPE